MHGPRRRRGRTRYARHFDRNHRTPTWTEEDVNAALQSAFWFDSHISEELIGPYRGTHIAILDKQIIAADRDLNGLCRSLDAERPTVPTFRLVIRFVPTVEESMPRRW
jgi:hypothetical protein